MRIDAAAPADVAAMTALLEEVGMPARFIDAHLPHFLVLRADGAVRGCAGLEVYGSSCLLRSLAVHPDYRGKGWGSALIKALIVKARELGLSKIVALTPTAVDLLRRFGFVQVDREVVDPRMRASWQFAESCCASAVCMRLVLDSGETVR